MITIITSFANKTNAMSFGKKLLKLKLIACCSLFPGVSSMYHWKGKDVVAGEVFLLIKTTAAKRAAVKSFIDKNHPYELPEFFSLNVNASKEFDTWVSKQVK